MRFIDINRLPITVFISGDNYKTGSTLAAARIMTIETNALTKSDFDSFLHLTHLEHKAD